MQAPAHHSSRVDVATVQRLKIVPLKEMWKSRPGDLVVLPGELLCCLGICCSQDIIWDPACSLSGSVFPQEHVKVMRAAISALI